MDELDTYFQNMLHVSDMVAVIENFSSLTIQYRLIPIAGSGFVEMKNADWSNFYCPETEENCFFMCLDYFGIKLSRETIHNIRTKLHIGSYVTVKQIEKILTYINTPLQVIINNLKKDGTFANIHDITLIPKVKPENCSTMHLGHIHNHYFLIDAPAGLEDLKKLHAR